MFPKVDHIIPARMKQVGHDILIKPDSSALKYPYEFASLGTVLSCMPIKPFK
jgi:hypothetical protein